MVIIIKNGKVKTLNILISSNNLENWLNLFHVEKVKDPGRKVYGYLAKKQFKSSSWEIT